jgi:hypothetical protein
LNFRSIEFEVERIRMDLDPTRVSVQEDLSYSDYDNRPIRPMNQEALNETLARLPILIDEEDYNNRTNASIESNTRYLCTRSSMLVT